MTELAERGNFPRGYAVTALPPFCLSMAFHILLGTRENGSVIALFLNKGAIAFNTSGVALIREREVSPLASSALEGGGWTSRKRKTARCKFLETVGRFLSDSDKRTAWGKNVLIFYVELSTCWC